MQPFDAKYQGRNVRVVDITSDLAVLDGGEAVPVSSVQYPRWDPQAGLSALAKTAAEEGGYEVYTATRGRRLAHIVPVGSGRGVCGTTVDPLWQSNPVDKSRVFTETKALALATCDRCKAVLRGAAEPTVWHAASDGRTLAKVGRWALEVVGSTWFAQARPGEVISSKAEDPEQAQAQAVAFATESILLDEPEPALPETLGEGDEEDIEDKLDDPRLNPPHERDELTAQRKTALKDFAPHEQDELIAEGVEEGSRARNLDRLLLEGTHYDDEIGLW